MATEFNEQHHRDIITIDLDGIPYSGWLVHCCPGDFTAIKAELPSQAWLELRCGNCLIALGEFSPATLDPAEDVARAKDTFAAPRANKDRPA